MILNSAVKFFREMRDEADGLEQRIFSFFVFLILTGGAVFFAVTFMMLAFSFPGVVIPVCLTIFIVWKGYNRL